MTKQDTIKKWVKLLDREYIISLIGAGKSQKKIASEIGCSRETLREVLRYHSLKYPYVIPKK